MLIVNCPFQNGTQMINEFPGIDNLLDNALCIQKTDRILVAGDHESEDLVHRIIKAIEKRHVHYSCLLADYDGKQIPGNLSQRLLDDQHNVILLLFKNSIWHQEERRTAKYIKKKRIASFSGTLDMLMEGPALADPEQLQKLCEDLKPHIEAGNKIALEGPKGTIISGECSGIGFESGLYKNPGEGGNFPAGEIYSLGLIDKTVNGYVHSNIKVKHLGLSAPGNDAVFEVKQGKISPVQAQDTLNFFSLIEGNPELFFVGELAFGICPYEKYFEYIDSVQEEKILGTAHIGLGSNISFGGTRKGKHLDLVFGPANVTIDQKPIITDGKINTEYLSSETRKWIMERESSIK